MLHGFIACSGHAFLHIPLVFAFHFRFLAHIRIFLAFSCRSPFPFVKTRFLDYHLYFIRSLSLEIDFVIPYPSFRTPFTNFFFDSQVGLGFGLIPKYPSPWTYLILYNTYLFASFARNHIFLIQHPVHPETILVDLTAPWYLNVQPSIVESNKIHIIDAERDEGYVNLGFAITYFNYILPLPFLTAVSGTPAHHCIALWQQGNSEPLPLVKQAVETKIGT